jgi:peptidoglycan hydrolase CwlO-like protein
MASKEKDIKAKFYELTHMLYVNQAKWFLNGFWAEGAEKDKENIWNFAQKFMELDPKKKEGTELDEFWSHKFLESLGETLTVIALREKLRKIDLDCNGKMALLEYLTFKYNKNVKAVVDAPQGGNEEEIKAAQEKLEAVQSALVDLLKQLEEQKRTEEAVKRSEAELKVAVDELKNQEDAYYGQIKSLEQKSKDSSSTLVTRNKAAAELAQLKGENPLPLRKAKITQEAALRKVEKERKLAEAQTQKVEAAVTDTENALKEAQEYLEEVKRQGSGGQGSIWWMERELKEAQKYLPKRKQTP